MGRRLYSALGRSVAQPGRAPRSGRGGRRFKSCHSDQYLAEIMTLPGTDCVKRHTKLRVVLIAALALAVAAPDAQAQAPSPPAQPARTRFNLPAPGAMRFVPNEVIL